jgi:rhamnose utilization protein RhaD (predicted bifunctional aldolase and dehydrogenase)
METNLKQLIWISRYFGRNPDYVIAGGGNTSFKDDEKLWVKASGISMADIDENGFVCLDRKKLQIISTKKYSNYPDEREQEVKEDMNKAILYPENKRPSVETSMHEMIQYTYVVHTHPALINGLLCSEKSKSIVSQLFGDEVLYVPYTDPGYTLFKAVETELKMFRAEKGKEPNIIFLENHGVFVAEDSISGIHEIYSEIEEKLNKEIIELPESHEVYDILRLRSPTNVLKGFNSSIHIFPYSDELTEYFIKDENRFKLVSKPFTPDNIVYCKSNYLFVNDESNLIQEYTLFNDKFGYYPKIIGVRGKGILALEENEKSAQIVLDVFKDMMKVSYFTQSFGGPRPLNQQQIKFIDNWEVENYRRKVSKGA